MGVGSFFNVDYHFLVNMSVIFLNNYDADKK